MEKEGAMLKPKIGGSLASFYQDFKSLIIFCILNTSVCETKSDRGLISLGHQIGINPCFPVLKGGNRTQRGSNIMQAIILVITMLYGCVMSSNTSYVINKFRNSLYMP
jgi:hypothetical protein